MSERFVGGVSAKMALYKYSSFPFLLLTTMEKSLIADIVKNRTIAVFLTGGILSRSVSCYCTSLETDSLHRGTNRVTSGR